MKTVYKIYELAETKVETFKGYSDGYGKEYKYQYTLFIPDWAQTWMGYDTEEEALTHLKQHAEYGKNYHVVKVYEKDSGED